MIIPTPRRTDNSHTHHTTLARRRQTRDESQDESHEHTTDIPTAAIESKRKNEVLPVKNWRKGQPTVLIDGNTYHTLEAATEWEISEEEEFKVTLAAHRGEDWIKKRDALRRKPALEKGPSGNSEWIRAMLAKNSTKLVTSQESPVLVASTPEEHQDAGTIKLDPEKRKPNWGIKGKARILEHPNEQLRRYSGTPRQSPGPGKGRGKTHPKRAQRPRTAAPTETPSRRALRTNC